jgi:LPXTG-motif cell wall-anchored protein
VGEGSAGGDGERALLEGARVAHQDRVGLNREEVRVQRHRGGAGVLDRQRDGHLLAGGAAPVNGLAETGASIATPVVIGALALLAGTGVVLITRRRRPLEEDQRPSLDL